MNLKFDITPKEHKIVLDILNKYLKTPAKIWIFGSRAKHKTKRNSDLDIAIESIEAIPFGVLADLEEAFTDAPLPYTVDIVEVKKLENEFQNIINQHKVLLTIIGNIPTLRFPEFRNAGVWEIKTLYEKIRLEYGGALPKSKRNDGNIPVIGSNGIVGYHNQYLILGPAIVIGRKGSVGQINWIESNCYPIDTTYYVVSIDSNNTLFEFIKLLLQNCGLSNLQDASAVPGLNRKRVYALKAAFPSDIKEQQKIAACLTALDDLISAATGRLDALKQHKQGLMQQLFPAEGETVPRLRFAEFREAGEWVEKELENCLLQKPEYGINAPAVPYSDKLPTYLRITDISEYGIFLSNDKVSFDRGVSEESYLSEGDIVLARTGASVGKSYKYRKKDGRLVFAGFLIRIKPDTKKLDSELLFQFLSTPQYWKWVSFISTRSGQPGINGTEYSLMPINLPPTIKEQRKIAACLTALDDLIAAQTQKIAKLKTHKRGLMQQLFPAVDETHR